MSQQTTHARIEFNNIAIVGVGLIGGSIAAAVKTRGLAKKVIGIGRRKARLDEAQQAGLLDLVSTDLAVAGREAELIVFCTPVDRIVPGVREAALSCGPGTVITDAGSVKGQMCRELATGLPAGIEFIGSHPLAGSEKAGFEFADAQLFEGRTCVITPVQTTSADALARIRDFWTGLGMIVVEMSPEAHDRALAETSHLPHLLAATLTAMLSDENRPLTATGYRDTTRIASGDPEVWTAIMIENADELVCALDAHHAVLDRFRQALTARDAPLLRSLLESAKTNRDALSS